MHIILYHRRKTTVSGNSLLYAGITLITRLVRCLSRTIRPWRLYVVEKKGHSYRVHVIIIYTSSYSKNRVVQLFRSPRLYNYNIISCHRITILYIIHRYLYTGSVEFFFHVCTSVNYVSR